MKTIYSRVNHQKILHIVVRRLEFTEPRSDLLGAENFLQCSALCLSKGTTFRPHQHLWRPGPERMIAQESWVVISGEVKCHFFDIDGKQLCDEILSPGDASFTLEGGHTYTSLTDNTFVYEFKTGPYEGQKLDKVFLS
jgi:cupin fold WbuC family metalloprotein